MVVDGTILDVMETWPLQLSLLSDETRIDVSLSMDTTVTKGDETVDMNQLRPGIHVQIHGRRVGESGFVADTITIGD